MSVDESGVKAPASGGAPATATTTVTRPQAPAGPELPPRPRRSRDRVDGTGVPTGTNPRLLATTGPGGAPLTQGRRNLSRRERKALGQLRARRVRRIVRHFDPWSVLKISLIFYFCLYVAVMVAGVILWKLAAAAGTIADVEGFIRELFAYETFEFRGGLIFEATLFGGLVLVVAGAAFNVLVAVLFNLISDLVGGIRVTVIEEETARPAAIKE